MQKKSSLAKIDFHLDKTLVLILLLIFATSLVSLYSAIPLIDINGIDILVKQVVWFILGAILLAFLLFFGIDRLFTGVNFFYFVLLILLFFLLVDRYIDLPFIRPVSGARAWYQIPGIGTFQPSEFMKVILIIQVANIIDEHNKFKVDMSYSSDIKLFIKIIKYCALPLILIFLQPDTGIPIIIFVSIAVMVMMSGIRKEWIIAGMVAAVIGVAIIFFLFEFYPSTLAKLLGGSYKLNRFYGWLETEKYMNQWGQQLYTSLLAIGSAGLTGHGVQSYVVGLLEPQNDFIFAVIGQSFGFIGACFTVILCTVFNLKLLKVALDYDRPREKYMVCGLLGMLLFQQFQNMGMIVGLLPITGITLPLISSGGSSLLSYMIPLAIVFHMSSENYTRHKQ